MFLCLRFWFHSFFLPTRPKRFSLQKASRRLPISISIYVFLSRAARDSWCGRLSHKTLRPFLPHVLIQNDVLRSPCSG
ncbi:hypothetical protein BJX99DRAFT_154122 [Aspergillus californicus]